jgi:TPP-dependent 2-oxoacid decarboxylase
MNDEYTVSRYILDRLHEAGVGHLFGVPGDYVLDFLDEALASPIRWIGTCNELNAGYAADGYARMNGIGGAVVTYGVGGLSIVNAVAGAYAEQVPMVVVSGAPPNRRREAGARVHHLVDNYQLQFDVFRKITVDAALLSDPSTAPEEIDRVLARCMARKLPGYLELPADVAVAPCRKPQPGWRAPEPSADPAALAACVAAAAERFNRAQKPVMLAGVELMRQGLGAEALRLVETAEFPFASMLSSKSLLPEFHPQFVGIYQGGWSAESVRRQVEESDCLLSLGVWMTDLDTGLFTTRFDEERTISAGAGRVDVGGQTYEGISLGEFVRALVSELAPRSYVQSHPAQARMPPPPFAARPDTALTAARLYECVDGFLGDDMVLLAEPGDSFCAAPDFMIEEAENFIVQTYYASIGYCTPAALGVSLARPAKRAVVLTGDGALQMTAQEISTLIRNRCPAVVVVVNNDGYVVERELHEDGAYNDIQPWRYAQLPSIFDASGDFAVGVRAETEEELAAALAAARADAGRFHLVEAWLPQRDCSAGLRRLGEAFRRQSAATKAGKG